MLVLFEGKGMRQDTAAVAIACPMGSGFLYFEPIFSFHEIRVFECLSFLASWTFRTHVQRDVCTGKESATGQGRNRACRLLFASR